MKNNDLYKKRDDFHPIEDKNKISGMDRIILVFLYFMAICIVIKLIN